MRHWWGWVMVMVALAGAASAQERGLERTRDGHLGARNLAPIEPPPPADHPHHYRDYMVYQMPEPLLKWAGLDKTLTRLCERGAFVQQKRQALYAVAGGVPYGVAFAEGANLHDPQKRAKPGTVYFFGRADTSHCAVYSAPQAKLARFVEATPGTLRPAPPVSVR